MITMDQQTDPPATATVFFATQDATTLACAVFLGPDQETASRHYALQWLARHYHISSETGTPTWEQVDARYETDGTLYFTLNTCCPKT